MQKCEVNTARTRSLRSTSPHVFGRPFLPDRLKMAVVCSRCCSRQAVDRPRYMRSHRRNWSRDCRSVPNYHSRRTAVKLEVKILVGTQFAAVNIAVYYRFVRIHQTDIGWELSDLEVLAFRSHFSHTCWAWVLSTQVDELRYFISFASQIIFRNIFYLPIAPCKIL